MAPFFESTFEKQTVDMNNPDTEVIIYTIPAVLDTNSS